MPANPIPPQPLLTPVTQPIPDNTGSVIHRIWSQWFNAIVNFVTAVEARVTTLEAVCPQVVTIAQQENLTADFPTTLLYTVPATVTNGLYRITCHNDLNLAGGKCTVSFVYVCEGVSRTFDGTQVTNVSNPVSWTYLFDPDPSTAISYYTTCVIPGGGIDYDLDLVLEQIPT
jgi:hypothetical protein